MKNDNFDKMATTFGALTGEPSFFSGTRNEKFEVNVRHRRRQILPVASEFAWTSQKYLFLLELSMKTKN